MFWKVFFSLNLSLSSSIQIPRFELRSLVYRCPQLDRYRLQSNVIYHYAYNSHMLYVVYLVTRNWGPVTTSPDTNRSKGLIWVASTSSICNGSFATVERKFHFRIINNLVSPGCPVHISSFIFLGCQLRLSVRRLIKEPNLRVDVTALLNVGALKKSIDCRVREIQDRRKKILDFFQGNK